MIQHISELTDRRGREKRGYRIISGTEYFKDSVYPGDEVCFFKHLSDHSGINQKAVYKVTVTRPDNYCVQRLHQDWIENGSLLISRECKVVRKQSVKGFELVHIWFRKNGSVEFVSEIIEL